MYHLTTTKIIEPRVLAHLHAMIPLAPLPPTGLLIADETHVRALLIDKTKGRRAGTTQRRSVCPQGALRGASQDTVAVGRVDEGLSACRTLPGRLKDHLLTITIPRRVQVLLSFEYPSLCHVRKCEPPVERGGKGGTHGEENSQIARIKRRCIR